MDCNIIMYNKYVYIIIIVCVCACGVCVCVCVSVCVCVCLCVCVYLIVNTYKHTHTLCTKPSHGDAERILSSYTLLGLHNIHICVIKQMLLNSRYNNVTKRQICY